MDEERERLRADQVEAETHVIQARKDLEKRQSERARAEQTLRETRRVLVQAETTQVQLKAHQNELTSRVEMLRKNRQIYSQNLGK